MRWGRLGRRAGGGDVSRTRQGRGGRSAQIAAIAWLICAALLAPAPAAAAKGKRRKAAPVQTAPPATTDGAAVGTAEAPPADAGAGTPGSSDAVDAADAATLVVVRFRNEGPGVTLRVDGGAWISLNRGVAVDVEGHWPSMRYQVARGEIWQYHGTLELRSTTARLVTLTAPQAHIELTNRSDEPLEVVWAGRRVATVKRDETRLLGPLEVDDHPLVCTGARSRHSQSERIRLAPGERVQRIIDPAPVGLHVENPSSERVRVLIDGRDFGALDPAASTDVIGLAPGVHRITLRGLRSGREIAGDAVLDEVGRGSAQQATTVLVLENKSGEQLRLTEALSGLHNGPIADGETVRMVLPSRPLRLRLQGLDSSLQYTRDVQPADGGDQRWTIERPTGRLHLRNHTGEAITLVLAGAHTIELDADADVVVRKVPAGRLPIVVTTKRSGTTFERVVQLEPDREISWRVRAGAATLIIDNGHAEPLEIQIDGVPRGQIAARSSFRVADASPGEHTILARTLWSRRIEAARALVVDGQQVHVKLEPVEASIVVANGGEGAWTVRLAGEVLGTVAAGRSRSFSVAAGQVFVDVEDDKGQHASWSGKIAPGQSLPMPAPNPVTAQLFVHNVTAAPLDVRVDERGEWQSVAPDARWHADDMQPGEHLVEMRAGDVLMRRRVTLRLDAPAYVVEPVLAR